ncbi:MAG: adenylyltransferase/cytidyltransferase family protein, partial [Solirubrobacteraceae bacterium]|nr:adenylyltransferase/cytidyltransferase family protein [Patulibacter sp.]
MTPSPRIAVCPGTYDPITNGHLDIITRAASTFDEVVVAVVHRPHRKVTTLFDIEERLSFIEDATSDLPNVRVQTFRTLIVDFAREVGA